MFKFLRSKAKVFYWVIAASFILFIFLAWGMDFRGSSNRGTVARGGDIGSIDGTPISRQIWDRSYQQILGQMRQQSPDRSLTANQYASAGERAWDQVVRAAIVDREIKRLGITASDQDVRDTFQHNPPPELLAYYVDESGQPDMSRYYADLSTPDPRRDWSGVESYIRSTIPQRKLQEIITAGVVVTEAEIRDAFERQYDRAVAEYVGVVYADLESEYEPTEAEIQAYYESHLAKYQQEAQAKVRVVVWAKKASDTDNEEVRRDLADVRQEILSGVHDFATAASLYSQDGSAQQGGDLGTFDRNRMVAAFSEAAFALPVGEISEPVKTRFGYHLIEVLEQEMDDDGNVEKIHARHILFNVDAGEDTLAEIGEVAAAFRDSVTAVTFIEAAKADSLSVFDSQPFEKGRDIPSLPVSVAGSLYAHQAAVGDISPVFENDENFYVLLVEEKTDAGPAPLSRVRSQINVELKRDHNRELAAAKLAPAVEKIQSGSGLEEVAAEFELKYAVTDTITATSNVADVGYGTAFNLVVLAAEVGDLVPEIATIRGLFALKPIWQSGFDEETYAATRDGIHASLLTRKQNALLEDWFQQKIAEAEVVDARYDLRSGV